MNRRTLVLSCLACLVAGYLVASVPGFDPVNPFAPKPERPVLKFLARIAKIGLWVAMFADGGPRPVEQTYAARHHDGSNICHAEGW